MTIRLATAARNASTAAVVARIDLNGGAGKILVYSGAQPATGDTAVSGTLLATIALAAVAFPTAASAGTANGADPAAVNVTTTGTAGRFRVVDGAGNAVFDGAVTATGGGGDMTLGTVSLTAGLSLDITSFSYSTPA